MPYINLQTGQYPLSEQQVREAFPDVSFPFPLPCPEGYAVVFPAPAPAHDAMTQFSREVAPVLTSKGHYEQSYEVVDLDAETIASNQAAQDAEDATRVAAKVDALWNAADKYVAGYISGIAIGLLTLGVVQSKPKALAVTAWSSAVWDAYYTRKASVTATSADDLDFSTFGPMPHTVPELRTELGL